MEDRATTLPPTSDLRLNFFPLPAQAKLAPDRRAKAQVAHHSERVEHFRRPQDFVECDCACK